MVETRRTRRRRRSEILIVNNQDIQLVWSYKYLGIVFNNSAEKTEEIKVRIVAANKAYYSLEIMFRFKNPSK
jgi:hypothetical protein